jgi:hypothetical protein
VKTPPPSDTELLAAIMECRDPALFGRLVYIYYHDADRAERTSRAQLYLHLGMLCGLLAKVCDDATPI